MVIPFLDLLRLGFFAQSSFHFLGDFTGESRGAAVVVINHVSLIFSVTENENRNPGILQFQGRCDFRAKWPQRAAGILPFHHNAVDIGRLQ